MSKKDEVVYDYNYLKSTIIRLGTKYDTWKVFNDFLILTTYSFSNVAKYSEKREQEYLKIINSYTKEEQALFPKMIASVVNSLSIEKYNDVLGTLFEELGLHNKFKGQFFTPNDVSYLIAEINSIYVEEIKDDIKNYGYFKLNDCACGSGRLFYSYLKMMKENNIDYNSQVFIEAQDISSVCVYMTYIQLSLYGVCAKVIHGDTLLNEIYDVFYTPMTIKYPFRFRDELK